MKKIRNFVAALTTALLLAGLAQNFNACTEQSPLQSEVPATGFKMLKSKNTSLNKVFQESQVIGADGGTIRVGRGAQGFSKLEVPEGALDDDVLITFWWESTGFLEGGADFSPHGTIFNELVRLELSYKDADLTGVDEDDLEIRYYNETTGQWEVIGNEVDKKKKVVVGYTDHFSRYAVGAE